MIMSEEVKIKKPPRKKNRLPEPPAVKQEASRNLTKPAPGQKVQLHMDVPSSFKKDLRILAAEYDTTMVSIVMEGIELWKEKFGKA